MLMGPLWKLSISPLVIDYNSVERVCGFKFLGVYISNDISWNLHVDLFVPEQTLACITSNGLSVLVILLTDLLLGIHPSSDQFLNTAQLFGTTAWGSIKQKRFRRFRSELFALFIQRQRLCHTGWRCSMLSFHLFQIGATNFSVIFFPQIA